MSVAKHDRRRFRLENENVGEKNVVLRQIEKVVVVSGSRRLQKTAAGLTARRYDVPVTLIWFESAVLDVSGSPDLPGNVENATKS